MSASSNPTSYRCLRHCAISAQAGSTPTMIGLECPSVSAVTAWSALVQFTRLRMLYEGCVYYPREIQQFITFIMAYAYWIMRVFLYRLTQPYKHVLTLNIRIRHVGAYAVSASCSCVPPRLSAGVNPSNLNMLLSSLRCKATRSCFAQGRDQVIAPRVRLNGKS